MGFEQEDFGACWCNKMRKRMMMTMMKTMECDIFCGGWYYSTRLGKHG